MFVFLREFVHEGGCRCTLETCVRCVSSFPGPFLFLFWWFQIYTAGKDATSSSKQKYAHTFSFTYSHNPFYFPSLPLSTGLCQTSLQVRLASLCPSGWAVRELHKWITLQKYTSCVLLLITAVSFHCSKTTMETTLFYPFRTFLKNNINNPDFLSHLDFIRKSFL